MYRSRHLCTAILCALALWIPTAVALGHPFHTTSAEMEFNSKSGRCEVSLRVLVSDLEQALSQQSSQRAVLTHTADDDGQIVAYLQSRILLIELSAPSRDGEHVTAEANSGAVTDEKLFTKQTELPTAGRPLQRLHWVGKELDKSWIWLYFELEVPAVATGVALKNTLFFELNAGQINTCVLRVGKAKLSLRTDAKQQFVALPPEVRLR